MNNYGIFWKMKLVTWIWMKKELLLIERNILLLKRRCPRNITRSENHLFLLYDCVPLRHHASLLVQFCSYKLLVS